MSTTVIQAAAIAVEATFGSMVNGTPDPSALTFYGMHFERGSLPAIGGTQETTPDTTARTGPFPGPPEPAAPWVNGAQVHRQTGDITFNVEVRGFGGGDGILPDANSLPFASILSSSMHRVDTGGARLTPAATGGNAGVAVFATGTGPALGELVLSEVDGCVVGNRVTDVAVASPNDTATFAQYWPSTLTNASRVQRGLNFMIRTGANFGTVGPSFAVRMQSLDGAAIAYGCRLRSVTFTSALGKLMAALVIKPGIIVPDTINPGAGTVTRVPPLLSPACVLRRAALRLNNDNSNIDTLPAPISIDAAEVPFEVDTFNLSVNFTLTDIGEGCGNLGIANTEVSGAVVTCGYTSRQVSAQHQLDLLGQVTGNLSIAAAPIQNTVAGSPNYLNGWAAFLPACHLTAAVNVEMGGEVTAQTYAWEAGDYLGDDSSGTATAANIFVMYLGGT